MPSSGSSTADIYLAPLSSRERLILAEWERARVNRITRANVAGRWGAEKADKITSALVRKGALRRVGKGIFLVVPLRAQARPSTPSAAAIVAALLSDEPYYLGGLWLLERKGVSPSRLTALRRRALATRSLTSMVPGTPRRGQVNARWRVVENDLRP